MYKYEGFIMDRLLLRDPDKFGKMGIKHSTEQYQFNADFVLTQSSF